MKRLLSILLLIATLFSLSSCKLISLGSSNDDSENSGNSQGDNADSKKSKQTVQVYSEGAAISYTFTGGETAQIEIPSKNGYYFSGAYDSPNGGTKYFDIDGTSVSAWYTGNPSVYYAHFDPISKCRFSEVQRDENPFSWHYGIVWFTFDLGEEFRTAIQANTDKEIAVSVSFDVTCDNSWEIGEACITNMKSGGEKFKCFSSLPLTADTYKKCTYQYKIKAKLLKSGTVYFSINAPYTVWEKVKYHIKNVELIAEFADVNA